MGVHIMNENEKLQKMSKDTSFEENFKNVNH